MAYLSWMPTATNHGVGDVRPAAFPSPHFDPHLSLESYSRQIANANRASIVLSFLIDLIGFLLCQCPWFNYPCILFHLPHGTSKVCTQWTN